MLFATRRLVVRDVHSGRDEGRNRLGANVAGPAHLQFFVDARASVIGGSLPYVLY